MNIGNGLEIGKRAIMTHAETLKITGQNIANANTPGYSRQKLELKDVSYDGDGATTLRAYRIRDKFTDYHIRAENQSLGEWDMRSQLYGQVESVFLEPSEHGLNNTLSEFWDSWSDLANDPGSTAPRSVVVQRGAMVANSLNRLDTQLKNLRGFANDYVDDRVSQINDAAERLAQLNVQIVRVEASGEEAGNMRDSRDLLLQKMSRLANTTVIEHESGSASVLIGGRAIVDEAKVFKLETQQVASGDMTVSNVVWADDDTDVLITGGELAGLVAMRDEIIPGIQNDLNEMTSSLIDAVNDIHSTGYGLDGSTGLAFFTGNNAYDITVNDELMDDVSKIAASDTGEAGSNSIALDIAALSDESVAAGGVTIGAYYSDMLESLGTRSHNAIMMKENAEMVVDYLEEQKESISGVSIDEEAADLIRFQHAYQSAAQYMSVINDLLETLINIA